MIYQRMKLGAQLIFLILVTFWPVFVHSCGISPSVQKYENALNGTDDLPLKIINGHESVNGDWPWLVNVGVYCTGSIIGKKWVLTAFHCETRDTIYYGDVNYENASTVTVANVYPVCPNCSTDYHALMDVDLLLLELEETLNFDETTSSICLANEINFESDDWAVAAGWGVDPFTGKGPVNAREEKIPMKPREYCGTYEGKLNVGEKEVCAGTDDLGVTPGDSGGPLMALKNGKWYQQGIPTRAHYGAPVHPYFHRGIYTDVTKFCDWIEKTTNGEVNCDKDNIYE